MTAQPSYFGHSAAELAELDVDLCRIETAAHQARQVAYRQMIFGASGTANDQRLAELIAVVRHVVERLPTATRPSDGRTK